MADFTPEDIARMAAAMRDSAGSMARSAGSMDRIARGEGTRTSAVRKLQNDLRHATSATNDAMFRFSRSMREATESADSFGRWFDVTAQRIFGGVLVSQIAQSIRNLSDTYKDLNEVGQTFSGSMFEMARQAGAASLSLTEFSELIKRNSAAAAVLGRAAPGGLPMLSSEVRKSARQFGMYGYTIDQLNEITGDYAETLRLQGALGNGFNMQAARDSIMSLAESASAFSNLTGRARAEISKQVNEALRDVLVTSRIQSQITSTQRASLERATAFLAALPGESGRSMSTFLAQTFGAGTALYTDQTQRFVEAGFGQAITMMDRLSARISAGEDQDEVAAEFVSEFVRQVDAANDGLRLQALAGNAAAREVLKMRDEMRATAQLTAAERAKAREDARRREALTAFASRFAQTFNEIVGELREGFYSQISLLERQLSNLLTPGGTVDTLKATFKQLGQNLGLFVSRVFTADNITRMGNAVARFIQYVADFLEGAFGSNTGATVGESLGGLFSAAIYTAEGLMKLGQGIGWFLSILDQNIPGLNTNLLEVIGTLVALGIAVRSLGAIMGLAGAAIAAGRAFARGGTAAVAGAAAGARTAGSAASRLPGGRIAKLIGLLAAGAGITALSGAFGEAGASEIAGMAAEGALGMSGVGTFMLGMAPTATADGTLGSSFTNNWSQMRDRLASDRAGLSPLEMSRRLEEQQAAVARELEQARSAQTAARGGAGPEFNQVLMRIEMLTQMLVHLQAEQGRIAENAGRSQVRAIQEMGGP